MNRYRTVRLAKLRQRTDLITEYHSVMNASDVLDAQLCYYSEGAEEWADLGEEEMSAQGWALAGESLRQQKALWRAFWTKVKDYETKWGVPIGLPLI
jgi:hypothetical protein